MGTGKFYAGSNPGMGQEGGGGGGGGGGRGGVEVLLVTQCYRNRAKLRSG